MSIRMTFFEDGNVKIEPQGYGGALCHQATKPYENAFGGEHRSTPTPEADLEPAVTPEEAAVRTAARG